MSTSKGGKSAMTAIRRPSPVARLSNPSSLLPVRQTPFDKLAPETIQAIFTYACPEVHLPALFASREHVSSTLQSSPYYLDPIALAMVCKRWRAVSIAHHSLWATIVIKTSSTRPNCWDEWWCFLQIKDRLARSGSSPLNITLKSDQDDFDDEEDEVISGILDLIVTHSERWRTVNFTFPLKDQFLQKLASVKGRLPLLESLSIYLDLGLAKITPSTSNGMINCAPFSLVPSLKCLGLRPISGNGMIILRNMKIPWTQISQLTLNTSGLKTKQDLHDILSWLSVSLTDLTFSYPWPLFTAWARWLTK